MAVLGRARALSRGHVSLVALSQVGVRDGVLKYSAVAAADQAAREWGKWSCTESAIHWPTAESASLASF